MVHSHPARRLPDLELLDVQVLSGYVDHLRRRHRAGFLDHRRGIAMLTKWLYDNKMTLRVVSSTGGMTALALVLAAPGKWK